MKPNKHMGPVDKVLLSRAIVDTIIAKVAASYDVNPSAIRSRRRYRQVAEARQMVMHLLVERGATLMGTARALTDQHGNGRDHGTVIHARRKILNLIDSCKQTRRRWNEVKHLADPEFGFHATRHYRVFMSANVDVLADEDLPREEVERRATIRVFAGRATPKMVDYQMEKI